MFCSLPLEIILQILHKLPIKSIVKCTCVCKSWYFLIKDPSFISTHLNSNFLSIKNKNHEKQLVLIRYYNSQEKYSLYLDREGQEFKEYMNLNLLFNTGDLCYNLVGSCNGVICLIECCSVRYILWNPSIQKFFIVPKLEIIPNNPHIYMDGFGFDCCTIDFKILRFLIKFGVAGGPYVKAELFSLKSGHWRSLASIVPEIEIVWYKSLPFVNGVIHCIGFQKFEDSCTRIVILGFDVCDEVFREITLPASLQNGNPYYLSVSVHKDLSIAVLKENMFGCQIWVMREYGVVESWTNVVNIGNEVRVSKVLRLRKNGKVLLERRGGDTRGGDIVSFDPENKEMEIHGIRAVRGYSFATSYIESLALLDIKNTARF